MKLIVFVVLVTFSLTHTVYAKEPAVRFTMSEKVETELGALAKDKTKEFARCLIGEITDNTIVALDIKPPLVEISFENSVLIFLPPCPPKTVAFWHNHPNGVCGLSRGDVATALKLKSIPVFVVHAGETVLCWWSQNQISRFSQEMAGEYFRPPSGQLIVRHNVK